MNHRPGRAGFAAIATVASLFFSIATAFMATASTMIVFAAPAHAAWPPALAPAPQRADEIRVDKSERRMELLRGGKVIKTYRILLGDAPVGHKHQQGDERTPEGRYSITFRNDKSRFHLSLRISYPNDADRAQARARGIDPGGDIMIHGSTPPGYSRDWTDGCIALTNQQIEEVWRLVPVGTPIQIDP
ncbi:MAG: L,D-transpeptidase family protein [Lysobacteraceae bacterium]